MSKKDPKRILVYVFLICACLSAIFIAWQKRFYYKEKSSTSFFSKQAELTLGSHDKPKQFRYADESESQHLKNYREGEQPVMRPKSFQATKGSTSQKPNVSKDSKRGGGLDMLGESIERVNHQVQDWAEKLTHPKFTTPSKVVTQQNPPNPVKVSPTNVVEATKKPISIMAIVLDDWGLSTKRLKPLTDMGRPFSIAVIPNLEHSADVANHAHSAGLEVMLHMPMQPVSATEHLEPHTILTSSSDAQIRDYLKEALRSVPHVKGVNNHMGSAATSDMRVMSTLMQELKKRHLFFVDSKTASASVGALTAAQYGVAFSKRDVFIDNKSDEEYIAQQINRAIRIAKKTGSVLVIGHDRTSTIRVLQKMTPIIEAEGVTLVSVSDYIRYQDT